MKISVDFVDDAALKIDEAKEFFNFPNREETIRHALSLLLLHMEGDLFVEKEGTLHKVKYPK